MSKLTANCICVVCNRALWFREFARNGVAPAVHLGRAREQAPLRTRHPQHSVRPGTGSDWNPDWQHTKMWTTTQQDFSRPIVVCNRMKKPSRRGGSKNRVAPAGLLRKIQQSGCQNLIF